MLKVLNRCLLLQRIAHAVHRLPHTELQDHIESLDYQNRGSLFGPVRKTSAQAAYRHALGTYGSSDILARPPGVDRSWPG